MVSAHRNFQASIDLADRHGLGRIGSANRAMAAFTRWFAGELDGALTDARAAIATAKRVGHQRAEMVAHHAAYFCLHDRAELDAAAEHAERSLDIARQIESPRFEAEGLAFVAEIDRLAGRKQEARAKIEAALALGRKSGMAFIGPIMLGTAALIADDVNERCAALDEADAILAAGAVSHNHLLFGRDAIEACLDMGDWERAGRYADRLAAHTRAEPLPSSDFFIARGRALAAVGRDGTGRKHVAALADLARDAERLAYRIALPALQAALGGATISAHSRASGNPVLRRT
jgi:hypothetical protein